VRICPFCDSAIPEGERRCPSCGELYWEPDGAAHDGDLEEEEDSQGCLSIFAVHFLVALAVFILFLFVGFIINLLVHFEENQIKVIWIGAALLLALAISGLIAKLRQNKEKGNRDPK
jgi:hypothetical protein